MDRLEVTFVRETRDERFCSPVEPHRCAAFAKELGHHLETDVPYISAAANWISNLSGYVIFDMLESLDETFQAVGVAARLTLAPRLVPVHPTRMATSYHEQSARWGVAGAIDRLSFNDWQRTASRGRAIFGLTGRRNIASRVGATCNDEGLVSPSAYCFVSSTVHRSLPHLLASYLRELHEMEGAS
jgi:hypothetical protein